MVYKQHDHPFMQRQFQTLPDQDSRMISRSRIRPEYLEPCWIEVQSNDRGPWIITRAEIRAIVHGLVGLRGALETTVSQSCDDVFLILKTT